MGVASNNAGNHEAVSRRGSDRWGGDGGHRRNPLESLHQRFPDAEDFSLRILDDRDEADIVDLIFRHHDLPASPVTFTRTLWNP